MKDLKRNIAIVCGGDSSEDSAAEDTAVSEDGPTSEQIQAVTEAYNQVATLYNEVATTANENGWMADEQTAADIQTIGATLEPVGTALAGDLSALDGADFDALPDALLEYVPELEALAEKVAEPYGGEDTAVVTDEALIPVANAVNEVVPIFNEVYELAEANGWLEDEQTATELLLECPNVKLYNFFDRYDVICNPGYYCDDGHYNAEVNSMMLSWISQDIGLVTKENYLDKLETEREFYSGYDYDSIYEDLDKE